MPFDQNIPVNGTRNDADPIRANMNVLNARCDALAAQDTATNIRIDQTDADVENANDRINQTNLDVSSANGAIAATNQRIDNLPPPGVTFPYPNNAQIDASLFVQGELALFESDPNGSGESGIRIGRASAGGVSVPAFTSRLNGAIPFGLIWDIGGFADGAGSPTIQDGALYRVDLASGMFKPWNVTVQTIQALDAGGNPITLQVICPPA